MSANLTYTNTHNSLTHIPSDIPTEAVNIYLHDNQIVTVHDDAFVDNVNCVKLRLDHNNLVTIRPSMWTGLTSLKWLDLSRNHIKHIEPMTFTELTELKGLFLSYNQLTTLTEDIFATDYHPDRLTLYNNPLPQDDVGLCWILDGEEEGWISGFTLYTNSINCNEEGIHNRTESTCCSTAGRELDNEKFTAFPCFKFLSSKSSNSLNISTYRLMQQ